MSLPVRPFRDSDMGYVLDVWRENFLQNGDAVRGANREHYRAEMERVVKRIVRSATVRIAYDPEDDDHIIGFAAYTGPELHYVYVKAGFRGTGIARGLLKDVPISSYTFKTNSVRPPSKWAFTPRFTIGE